MLFRSGLIDLPKEIERITKELKATGDELARLEKKLGNEGFLTKAKPEIVEKTREEAAALAEKKQALEARLAMLRSMQG